MGAEERHAVLSARGGTDHRPVDGQARVLRFFRYMFARHDPSAKMPPVPLALVEWAQDTSLALAVGVLLGGIRQWREERSAGPINASSSNFPTRAHAARAAAETQTQRLLRIANASVRTGIRFGGLAALFYGAQLVTSIYRDREDFYNTMMGGVVAGTGLGLLLGQGSPARRARGAILAAALGGSIGFPAGLLQDYIVNSLPEEQKQRRQQRLDQLQIITEGYVPRERPVPARHYDPAAAVISQLEASLAGSPTREQSKAAIDGTNTVKN